MHIKYILSGFLRVARKEQIFGLGSEYCIVQQALEYQVHSWPVQVVPRLGGGDALSGDWKEQWCW